MINRRVAVILAVLAPLAACVSGSSGSGDPNPNSGFQARFTPLGGIMPFPNDLYFNGSTTGTLNIPGSATVPQNAPLLALNHLDGFGTESDINVYFTAPVDPTTLAGNIVVLKVSSDATNKAVNPVAPAGTGSMTALTEGTDYSVQLSPGTDSGGEIVTIKPLHPLAASSVTTTVVGTQTVTVPVPATYLVVVTSGVKDTSGNPVSPSADYSAILGADLPVLAGGKMGTTGNASLDPVAQFILPQLIDAAAAKIDPTKIAVTFSFSTAYLGLSLAELSATATATAQPSGVGIVDTGETVCQVLVAAGELPSTSVCATEAPGSTATEVFAGTVALPYYLTVPSASDPTAALTDSWHNSKGGDTAISTDPTSILPVPTVKQNVIPILAAVPLSGGPCTMPGTGWPVVIFQHGITRNREDMFAMASGLGGNCFATVAIDLPLHGVTNTKDPFYMKGYERTFDMDLENNTTLAAGPDGQIDPSGAWFINLSSTITSRDNLREGAADLINLAATLPTLSAVTPSPLKVNTFDGSKIFFVGHSLGGIVGTDFLGADYEGHLLGGPSRIVAAVLANPGGHIAELLRNSAEFEPIIDAQLAANGLVKGTQAYYDFYSEAQAAVEDGDPANYATAAAAGHPIHMLEVVGTSASTTDQVVPNSSTDVLLAQMGITSVVHNTGLNPVAAGIGTNTLAQFTTGDHGSLLDPLAPAGSSPAVQAAYAAVTTEMQSEMVSLFLANGAAVNVTDNSNLTTSLQQ